MESCEGIYRTRMSCMTSSHDVNQGAAREATRGINLVFSVFLLLYLVLFSRSFFFRSSTGLKRGRGHFGRGRAYLRQKKKKLRICTVVSWTPSVTEDGFKPYFLSWDSSYLRNRLVLSESPWDLVDGFQPYLLATKELTVKILALLVVPCAILCLTHPGIPRCESLCLFPMVRSLFFIPLRTMSCSSMGEGWFTFICIGCTYVVIGYVLKFWNFWSVLWRKSHKWEKRQKKKKEPQKEKKKAYTNPWIGRKPERAV